MMDSFLIDYGILKRNKPDWLRLVSGQTQMKKQFHQEKALKDLSTLQGNRFPENLLEDRSDKKSTFDRPDPNRAPVILSPVFVRP